MIDREFGSPRRPQKMPVRKPRSHERGPGVSAPPESAGAAGGLMREARLRRDFTQTQVAELSGYDQSLLSRWERGHTEPSFAAVLKVLGACGYDLLVALQLVDLHGSSARSAELQLVDEPTPPDVHGFRRLARAEDAARRKQRADGRRPRGG